MGPLVFTKLKMSAYFLQVQLFFFDRNIFTNTIAPKKILHKSNLLFTYRIHQWVVNQHYCQNQTTLCLIICMHCPSRTESWFWAPPTVSKRNMLQHCFINQWEPEFQTNSELRNEHLSCLFSKQWECFSRYYVLIWNQVIVLW